MSDSASPPSTDDSSVNQPSAGDNSSTSSDNNSPAPTESSPGLDDSPPVPIDAQLNGASPAPEGSSKSPPPEESPSPPPPSSSSLPQPSSSPPPPKSKSQPPPPPSPKDASPQSQSPPANSSPPSTPNASPPPPYSSSSSHVPSSSTPSPQKSQPRLQTDPLSNQSTPSPPSDTTLPTPSSIPSNSTTLGDGSASNLPQNTPTQSLVPGQPSRVNSTANEKQPSSAINKAVSNTVTDSNNGGKIAGIIIGGVLILALIAVLFIVRRRKKKRTGPQYVVHNNYPHKADEYLYGQIPPTGHSGSPDSFYGVHTQNAAEGNSYGSPQPYPVGGPESGLISSPKSIFNYKEVMEMTKGFSRQNVIGEGGFGCVFKGWLHDGKMVAVKQLKAGSGQGEREFKAEVEIISRVHHRHLVSLVGYCVAENQRLLIYDFVPNKTLEHHLHGKGLPVLDWTKRVKIALGAAKGLAYLHEDCHPKIIHRDIKSSNILLDDVFEAQVADFGLAKLTNDSKSHVSTRVMGTFGYMAPEYASSGKLTDRSDVFSFGVVLLELVTGRKPVDPTQPLGEESLVEWARPLLIHALETRDFSELVDPRLEKHYVESELFRMIEVAAASVRHSALQRPRMAKVMRALDTEDDMLDLTNGVKYGQSIAYDSAQYSEDIMRFKRLALNCDNSSEFEAHGGEYTFRNVSQTPTS